jgi:hypothetical protein
VNVYQAFIQETSGVEKKVRVMVFNATFNNLSVISWRSVFFMEEAGESHRPAACY